MATLEKRIEYLNSNHPDNKEERTPKVNQTALNVVRFGFQALGSILPTPMAHQAYRIFATPRWRARHAKPDALIKAAKIWDLPFDGHTVKIYEWGNPEGRKILLAHGWESRGTALRMFVPDLIAQGFHVVAYDALAHGDSTGERNNLPTNARTMAAVINHFGGIYGAIGHSFGCSTMAFMQQFVDNSIAVERVVFLAVPHGVKKIMDGYLAYIKAPASVRKAFIRLVEGYAGMSIADIDVAKAYPSVKVGKLLLIHDEEDNVTSIDAAENVVRTWDNAHLLVTKGYGHYRIAKNPDVIKRIVSFISN